MKKVEYVFVLVVYRNYNDVDKYVSELKETFNDYQVVVVNSYYDEESKALGIKTAEKHNCDFINIENKGYGYGNNRGIEYANAHYDYRYLVVCNADICIEKFNPQAMTDDCAVYGPLIKTLTNKAQNPYWAGKGPFAEWLIYRGLKNKNKLVFYTGIAINKIRRLQFLFNLHLFRRNRRRVFALHGSFLIFTRGALDRIGLPYDEEMFLFAEEAHLAHLLRRNHIKSYVCRQMKIKHYEDGSIVLKKIDEKDELRKSVMTYYPKLSRKGEEK